MEARLALQARIDAQQDYDALVYGQRTLAAMGGKAYGITEEWGAADWAIAQWGEAIRAAAVYGEDLAEGSAMSGYGAQASNVAWKLKKAKKAAAADLAAAKDWVKSLGTARQFRLALEAA